MNSRTRTIEPGHRAAQHQPVPAPPLPAHRQPSGSETLSDRTTARRVTVVTPTTRVDVALPTESAIAEIVPQLTHLAGLGGYDPNGHAGGWLLGRLGHVPFEPARTVAGCRIADGELLYLTPRSEQLPEAAFDDMIEAVADAADSVLGLWRATTTRAAALAVTVVAMLAALALLVQSGASPVLVAVFCALAAATLATTGGLVSRAVGEGTTGAALSLLSLPYAATATLLLSGRPPWSGWVDGPILQAVCATLLFATVVASLACGRAFGGFVAVAATATVGLIALGAAGVSGASQPAVAAVTAAVLTAARPLMPMLALRLGQIKLPGVPADAEEFRVDRPSIKVAEVAPATARTAAALTALHAATAVVLLVCLMVMLRVDDPWATAMAAVVTVTSVLRVRSPLRSRDQRLILLAVGVVGAAGVLTRIALDLDLTGRVVMAAVVLAAAAVAADFAVRAPGRSGSPYWGRFYDIVEFVALASILPLAAQLTDLYSVVRPH